MDGLVILIIVGVLAAGIGLAMLAHKKERERQAALAAMASGLGWAFTTANDPDHDARYGHFAIFKKGHSRRAYNTMTGTMDLGRWSVPVRAGDYLYKVTTSNGKTTTTTTYRFSYLIIELPFPGVPELSLRPEGFFDRVAQALGAADIDFESAEFSRRFVVKGSDKRFAYAVIHPRMMEFLMEGPPRAMEIEFGRCCVSDGKTRLSAPEFAQAIEWVRGFFQRWPDYLVKSLMAGGGAAPPAP